MKSSLSDGSLLVQSANLPGSVVVSKALFLMTASLAALAAAFALLAKTAFPIISLATLGFSSKYVKSSSLTSFVTTLLTSGLFNLIFVCPSNCGFGTLTETIAVKPSLTSSPLRVPPIPLRRSAF